MPYSVERARVLRRRAADRNVLKSRWLCDCHIKEERGDEGSTTPAPRLSRTRSPSLGDDLISSSRYEPREGTQI